MMGSMLAALLIIATINFESRFVAHGGVIYFHLNGGAFNEMGFFYTKVKVGTPPTELLLQVDSGSSLSWVDCGLCPHCPSGSTTIPKNYYNSSTSLTASLIGCTSPFCKTEFDESIKCSAPNCSFSILYGDQSAISGHMMMDKLYFDAYEGPKLLQDLPIPFLFGCGTRQAQGFQTDGILGLGPGVLSFPNQVATQMRTPKTFSHCLKGDAEGGGTMVLGEAIVPGMIYASLVSQRHYNVHLRSIAVNGHALPIDKKAFQLSKTQEVIVDSGTTLSFLVPRVLEPLVTAINAAITVSGRATSVEYPDWHCYDINGSISEIFPVVSFIFVGGAAMHVRPEHYLTPGYPLAPPNQLCIGFREAKKGPMILGDLVLKDKVVIYDLEQHQIGWADYDCRLPMNVSTVHIPKAKIARASTRTPGLAHIIIFVILELIVM